MDFEYWYIQLARAGINVIFAWSVYASFMTGTVSLGQAAFYAIGAFVSASFTMILGWHIVPAILMGALVAAFIGLSIAIPMARLRGPYLMIATLAFAEIIRITLYNMRYGRNGEVSLGGQRAGLVRWIGPDGNLGFDYIMYLWEYDITNLEYALWIMLVVAGFGLLFYLLDRSRLGYAMRAVEADEIATQSIGLSHKALKISAFTLGAAIAGIAGGLHAHLFTYLRANDFGLSMAVVALAYVIIGGSQTFWGAALAALILTLLPEAATFTKDYQVVILGVFIMLTMIFRPSGIVTKDMILKLGRKIHLAFARS